MLYEDRLPEAKALLYRLFAEVITDGNLTLADQIIAPDFISHHLRPGQSQGLAGFKAGLMHIRSAFPDWRSVPEAFLAENDQVAARWTVQGTHLGPFMGMAASGRRIVMREMGFFRISAGKIVEFWGIAEELTLLQQLGAIQH